MNDFLLYESVGLSAARKTSAPSSPLSRRIGKCLGSFMPLAEKGFRIPIELRVDLLFLQTDMIVPPNFTFSDGRTALPIILAAVFLFVKGEENVVRNRIFMDSPGEIQAFCIPKREGGPPQNLRWRKQRKDLC